MKSLSKSSKSSSVTPLIYNEIGDFFRSRFGMLAGWAHTILFAAELHDFKKIMSGEEKIHNEEVLEKFKQEVEAAEKNAIVAKIEEIAVKEEPREEELKVATKNSKKRKRAATVKSEPKESLAEVKVEEVGPVKAEEEAFVSAADRVKQRKRHKPN